MKLDAQTLMYGFSPPEGEIKPPIAWWLAEVRENIGKKFRNDQPFIAWYAQKRRKSRMV